MGQSVCGIRRKRNLHLHCSFHLPRITQQCDLLALKNILFTYGAERMHMEARSQLLWELVLFFHFVLRQGLSFQQLNPRSKLLANFPISTFYLTTEVLGIQMHHTAPGFLCGLRGMNSGCWVFIAFSSVFTHWTIFLVPTFIS